MPSTDDVSKCFNNRCWYYAPQRTSSLSFSAAQYVATASYMRCIIRLDNSAKDIVLITLPSPSSSEFSHTDEMKGTINMHSCLSIRVISTSDTISCGGAAHGSFVGAQLDASGVPLLLLTLPTSLIVIIISGSGIADSTDAQRTHSARNGDSKSALGERTSSCANLRSASSLSFGSSILLVGALQLVLDHLA